MFRRIWMALGATLLLVMISTSAGLPAQAPGRHPLRPEESATQPDAAGPFIRQRKPASERQRESAARTRLCGAEWRALRAAGQDKGRDWRLFSRECRDRLKARGH